MSNKQADKYVQKIFKWGNLQGSFWVFLTGCRLFANIKILVILLVTDLNNNTKDYFSNSMLSTKNDFF